MTDLDREDVRSLIRQCIPNTDALEVFIVVSADPDRTWTPGEIRTHMQATVATGVVATFLESFRAAGLVFGRTETGFHYHPKSPELALAAERLVRAYNERPVTLIRTIYSIADAQSIQSFANAFRIRKDP